MRTLLVVVSVATLLAAACGSDRPPSPSASTQATAPPSTSASALRELPGDTEQLPPGRYARADLVPGVSFEVDEGWSSGRIGDGSIEIQRVAGDGEVIVSFALVSGGVGPTGETVAVDSADSAVNLVREIPGIEVLATSDSLMSGRTGPNLELENSSNARLALLTSASSEIGLDPGARSWLSLFDTDDGVLAIAVTSDAATWDDALVAAETLLESVTILG